jgi:hypothetical protein
VKLDKIYRLAVDLGSRKDPRGKAGVEQLMADARKEYEDLKGDDKRFFDKERLSNPFADTRR